MDVFLPFLDVLELLYSFELVIKCNVTLSSASVYLPSLSASEKGISCSSRQYDSWQRVEYDFERYHVVGTCFVRRMRRMHSHP